MSATPRVLSALLMIVLGHRHRGICTPHACHQRCRRPGRRDPGQAREEVRRHPRRDLSALLHRPRHRAYYDVGQGAAAERLSAGDDVQAQPGGDQAGEAFDLVPVVPSVQADTVRQINEAGEKKHLRGFWTHKYDENDRR